MRSLGNRNDICCARELLEPYDLQGRYVIADKGYDSDRFVERLKKRGAIVVIPSRRTARHPRSIDRHIYMERHLVENLFLKLKVHRHFLPDMKNEPILFSLSLYSLLSLFGLLEFEDTL